MKKMKVFEPRFIIEQWSVQKAAQTLMNPVWQQAKIFFGFVVRVRKRSTSSKLE